MTKEHLNILTNIIGAVESGGQIYGKRRYDAYAAPYTNSNKKVTITLGWAQNYGNEGRKLCKMILSKDPVTFRKLDTTGIEKKLSVDWVATKWKPTTAQKNNLIAIITTDAGKQCQDKLFQDLMETYIKHAKDFGVLDIKAQMMWCECEHLGGLSPTKRVFTRAKKPYTPDSIFASLILDQKDTSNNNQIGDKKFQSRHECCMRWIKQYVKDNVTTTQEIPSQKSWIEKGDTGEAVKNMQTLLIENGFHCGDAGADGIFGNDTEKALKQFQTEYRLTVDGQYGIKSKAVLENLSHSSVHQNTFPFVGEVTADILNVRQHPNRSSDNLKSYPYLKKGNLVSVEKYSSNKEWYFICISNIYHGYVSTKFIERR